MYGKIGVLASALLAVSIGAAQPACAPFDARVRQVVGRTMHSKESQRKEDLEDIMRSVHCIRNEVTYQKVGKGDQPKLVRRGYGTAFAYERRDGQTYLVTNHHVIDSPSGFYRMERGQTEGSFSVAHYRKISERFTLVDDARDSDPKDDVVVSKVREDENVDIAVLRTKKDIHVSDRFVFDPSFEARRGDEVYLLGFPKALVRAQTKGVVADPAYKAYDGAVYHALDVTGTFGSSGSPYFVRRGERFHWAGNMRAVNLYQESYATLFSLGIPIKQYSGLLRPAVPDMKAVGVKAVGKVRGDR